MHKVSMVDEVRRIRHEIERECQQDPDKLFEYYRASQKKFGDRIVRRGPRRLEPVHQQKRED